MSDKLVIGCGYLGRRVAARWRRPAIASSPPRARADTPTSFNDPGWNPSFATYWTSVACAALPDAADVAYCVGLDRTAGVDMRTVYVDGLANVLTALAGRRNPTAGVGRFVYVSSTGVYAQSDGEEVDETAATAPAAESGRVVLDAERLLHRRRPDAIILRFAGIYGPGRLIREKTVRAGEPLSGDPDQWLNLIHVEDGAAAVVAALERGRPGGVYNVCDDRPVRRRDFYTRMAEVLGAPPPRFAPSAEGADADRVNRRIVNRRMREELAVALRYPSYEEGLEASANNPSEPRP